jgi:hypothetical protein
MPGLIQRTFKSVNDTFVGLFFDTGSGVAHYDAGVGAPTDVAAADNTVQQSLISLARRRNNTVEKSYGSPTDTAITDGTAPNGTFFSLLKGIILGLKAVADINAPYKGAVPMTVGTPVAAARALRINCGTAGDVSVTYADNSIDVFTVTAGLSIIPGAIVSVNASGTTAVATYANLK